MVTASARATAVAVTLLLPFLPTQQQQAHLSLQQLRQQMMQRCRHLLCLTLTAGLMLVAGTLHLQWVCQMHTRASALGLHALFTQEHQSVKQTPWTALS
jgi:hypothetical protein